MRNFVSGISFLLLVTFQGYAASAAPFAQQTPTLGDMFLGGAVLQRGTPVQIWGTSAASSVTVTLDGHDVQASVSNQEWIATIPPQRAAFNRTLRVRDSYGEASSLVSIGETILCVGQSNMGMQVGPTERAFDADNATAENAASVLYTGKIWLHAQFSRFPDARGAESGIRGVHSTVWYAVTPESIKTFSAVCWLTGRDLFNSLGGTIPMGLVMNAAGAHSLENWVPPETLAQCGVTTPCVINQSIGQIWNQTITPMQPYTFGSMVWDQAEQNLNCDTGFRKFSRVAKYPCMQAKVAEAYRTAFNATFPFVAVQLPGYTEGVFEMRLAQEKGADMVANAAVVPTYDLSCSRGTKGGCPKGAVHNVHKQPVGARVAKMLRKLKFNENIADGPRVQAINATKIRAAEFAIQVAFDSSDLFMRGTRNCTACCRGNTSDFDFSADGKVWYNGTTAKVSRGYEETRGAVVQMRVNMPVAPTMARYTANQVFPQCAVYANDLPAYPFMHDVVLSGN